MINNKKKTARECENCVKSRTFYPLISLYSEKSGYDRHYAFSKKITVEFVNRSVPPEHRLRTTILFDNEAMNPYIHVTSSKVGGTHIILHLVGTELGKQNRR
jgi:hypothetical protein